MESIRNASSLLNSAQACLNPQMDPNLVSKLADTKEALTTITNAHNDATMHPSVELWNSANILLDFIEKFEVSSSELYCETADQVALSACPINVEIAYRRFRRHSFYSSQNSADTREHVPTHHLLNVRNMRRCSTYSVVRCPLRIVRTSLIDFLLSEVGLRLSL